MKFILTFQWRAGSKTRDEGIARFAKGAGNPPKGVRLLGRWTQTDLCGGFDLLESDDPQALTEFALAWSDLMELRIVPVVDDEGLTAVLRKSGKM